MRKNNESNLLLIMIAIFIATFMTSVETTIVTTAMPTIISKLNGLSLQSWVFAMYLLTTAVSTPIYGKLSDRIGRKPVFMMGLIVFSLGSFLCGISSNIYSLIFFRAIQGIGGGAIIPTTFTMIADLFTYERRSNMLAMNNTAWGISALLGPLIGGFIVDKLNWHWIFFVNVPLGIIVLILTLIGFKENKKPAKKDPIDVKGIFSLSGFLVSLLLLFQLLGNKSPDWLLALLMAIIFIAFAIWFVKAEKRAIDPMIPLTLFKNKLFTIEILTASLLSGVQSGFQIYFPIWLQSIYKVPASVAGLAITPSPVMWLVASFFVGALVKRFIPKNITIPIAIIQLLFYIPLIFARTSFPMLLFYIISGVTGAGLGIVVTMNILVAQEVVGEKEVATASSMLTLGRTLGQTVMTSVLGLIFNLSINQGINKFKNVNLHQANQFISSNSSVHFNATILNDLQTIILKGMHTVFLATIMLFIIIVIINFRDKNKDIIK
ncbi:MFS transporter [Companilactobacillus halodurans]|uniref:MFS transporter n=1 Tax=Companilactobacillus halodurans TaxID=2584183 RepID=A0A5P0ZQ41_9LACO|nr:MFS transporter [Companilactobacillus halodurans]MQS76373.1 MFS transporter [Companilactobacillus halodurans]MQS96997.1 MFS transporter [Companilactobacillus halodurans]